MNHKKYMYVHMQLTIEIRLMEKYNYQWAIFAGQVSDSLALIYPLADLVGFSKPSQ